MTPFRSFAARGARRAALSAAGPALTMARAWALAWLIVWALASAVAAPAAAASPPVLVETPILDAEVEAGRLPPVAERTPDAPLVVDLEARGREVGRHGGVWRMLIDRAKSQRYGVAFGYARLVGYDGVDGLKPDLLADVEVVEGRTFTLKLRPGHRWSDGHPFTSEDFRYWWEDVANNAELAPAGPPAELLVDGAAPTVTFPDETTVVFDWPAPNPTFLKLLAGARPPFIYRPAHYLKKFHAKYTDVSTLEAAMAKKKARSWAALHNRTDNMYRSDNPDLPSLQPWVPTKAKAAGHFIWVRNPYYHRVDVEGRQLPYIDKLDMTVVSPGLIPAKANAGETDLQGRNLDFQNAAILKKGEAKGGYRTLMWKSGVASQIAIYPNLNYGDPVWRKVMRDRRFRQALSLGVNRSTINRLLFYGLAQQAATSLLPESPLFDPKHVEAFASFEPERANALLDEMGLTDRAPNGLRVLPDGRVMEFIVETAGERVEVSDALELITTNWADLGIKLIQRPLDRDILRNRVYSGASMSAVWFGWENGLAGPNDPPADQTPMKQEVFSWPKWGQNHQTKGAAGAPPDTPEGERLMALGLEWHRTLDEDRRRAIWREILDIHAAEVFSIGLVNSAPQPIVVSARMANVPEKAVWAWEPTAQFGAYRTDEFFFREE